MIDSDFDRSYDQLWFCYQNNTFFILKQVPVDNFFQKNPIWIFERVSN